MNKFYNISFIAVLCLGINGLGASETQGKLSFIQLQNQKLKSAAKYYAGGYGLFHALGTGKSLYGASMDLIASSHNNMTDRQVMTMFGKRVLAANGKVLLMHFSTVPVFFGGVIGWNTAKEMWYVLNTPYKTLESAKA